MAHSAKTGALLQLIPFDRPIGTLLLLWPTLWALWLAAEGVPAADLLVTGKLLTSHGKELVVVITARDSAGYTWLHKRYVSGANPTMFEKNPAPFRLPIRSNMTADEPDLPLSSNHLVFGA